MARFCPSLIKIPIILALVAVILQLVFMLRKKPVGFFIFSGLVVLAFWFSVSFFKADASFRVEWLAVLLPYVFAAIMAGAFISYSYNAEGY